jgi:hypothetical protein
MSAHMRQSRNSLASANVERKARASSRRRFPADRPVQRPNPTETPAWRDLPEETRSTLTGLMTRLIRRYGRRAVMITDRLRPRHLERKALLYVRQSSAHQVLHNRESSALQYAMRDRLTALGWSEIEVIDEDLGRSAAGSVQRAGFEPMVAEVCLGKVGARCRPATRRRAEGSLSSARRWAS